jgi:hypothetical protein
MPKARSRLKSTQHPVAPPASLTNTHPTPSANPRLSPRPQKQNLLNHHLTHHRQHLALLLLCLPFYLTVGAIMTKVNPDTIAHFLLPSTFLPLQFPLFLANFFFFSFIFLNSRRGLLLSLLISILLFLKLQQVVFEVSWFIGLLVSFILVELAASMISFRNSLSLPKPNRHESIRPTKRVRFEARRQPGQ